MWQYLGKLKYMHKIPEVDFGGFITYMNKKIRTIITHHNNILVVNSQHPMHIHVQEDTLAMTQSHDGLVLYIAFNMYRLEFHVSTWGIFQNTVLNEQKFAELQ